jgi:hypothetical protein
MHTRHNERMERSIGCMSVVAMNYPLNPPSSTQLAPLLLPNPSPKKNKRLRRHAGWFVTRCLGGLDPALLAQPAGHDKYQETGKKKGRKQGQEQSRIKNARYGGARKVMYCQNRSQPA